jgi:hypothetical protein
MKIVNHGRWLGLGLALLTSWCAVAQDAAPAATPPPSAPPQRSAAELRKLAEPIALYPDPLISIVLPAAAYPVEIVQAARFVRNTSNIPKVDEQPWDQNVKSVAKFPQVIAKMDADLDWTVELGEAFVGQPKELMDAIQALRGLAQNAGTLQTTPQQVVWVTNVVVVQTNVTQIVTVTNKIVEIVPASPQVVYVPTYLPTVYYPPPAYVYNPLAPLITFGAGIAVGAIIANNCNWYHGGVYVGPHGGFAWGGSGYYHGNVNVNVNNFNNYNNRNVNVNNANYNRNANVNVNNTRNTANTTQQWHPDQNRMSTSGARGASASTQEARGWSSGQGAGANAGARPSTGNMGARPSTGNVGARPSSGNVGGAGSSGNFARPSTGGAGGSRPTAAPTTSNYQSRSGGSSSAFSGGSSGSAERSYSSRGSSSRSSGGYSGGYSGGSRGGFSGGGGGRGGGRR